MPNKIPTTSLRLTPEDREVLEVLQRLTGSQSAASAIRLAIREAIASRGAPLKMKKPTKGRK